MDAAGIEPACRPTRCILCRILLGRGFPVRLPRVPSARQRSIPDAPVMGQFYAMPRADGLVIKRLADEFMTGAPDGAIECLGFAFHALIVSSSRRSNVFTVCEIVVMPLLSGRRANHICASDKFSPNRFLRAMITFLFLLAPCVLLTYL